MKAQIRLAESGHSYHYSELTTVHSLMQQIRKDFKIEMEDQKIIMKSGEILKSTTTFQSVQQKMKKTITTANSALINRPSSSDKQVTEIECLYVYNQKQLLKPIEVKNFTEDFYLKILNQKCRQMSPLAQSSYQYKQFCQTISQKNINGILELINKRLKNPLQNLVPRYNRSLNNLNQRNYCKLQISAFLDLIQNQEKARKLLIRNIEYILESRIKRKLVSIAHKIEKQGVHENQIILKENSGFFSSIKQNSVSQSLNEFNNCRKQIQQKLNAFIAKYKKEKKSIINKQFLEEEKITYNVDKNITILEKEYDENIKFVKDHYEEFCEELIKINVFLSKGKQKDIKQLSKNLFAVNDKISSFQSKIQDHISKFSCMYVQLSKIHTKGQTQSIKIVFATYIQLTKGLNQIDQDIRKLQKEFLTYKEAKAHEIQVSQFNQSKNNNLPLKKVISSPKKQQKQNKIISKSQKAGNAENENQKIEMLESQINEQKSFSKQKQSNFPKIHSPIKSKMGKHSKNSQNDEIESRQLKSAVTQNKQLIRRIHFNKRLQGLQKYCLNLCQKQQDYRRNFRNSKIFEQNKIDLLGKLNVPTIQIDYTQTSDTELAQLYKRLAQQGMANTQSSSISWQNELVQTTNCVYKTLTTYLASKSNATQREKNIEKILSLLGQTFYKMMKAKVDTQTQSIKASTREQIQQVYCEKMSLLQKQNYQLCQKLKKVNKNLQGKSLQSNQSSKLVENLERFQEIENKYQQLAGANQQLEDQNKSLNEQIKNMQEKLIEYQEEMDQITQKLINSLQQQSNPDQIEQTQQLRQRLKVQNQTKAALDKQVKDLKIQLQKAKKNLVRQVEACETLYKQIQEISGQRQFYEREFSELKNMLADRQIIIIKLERQIQERKKSSESNKMSHSQQNEENHSCQCTEQLILLRQQKQGLQQQIQHLDKELKQIIFKQTEQQEVQTQQAAVPALSSSSCEILRKQKENIQLNISRNENKQTQKMSQGRFVNSNIQAATCNYYSEQVQSRYYVSSMAQQWVTSFPKLMPLTIGKSIEQGMCHIFLPFSSDIYVGVTFNEDSKNYTNYREFISDQSQNVNSPIYILDLKQYNQRTNQMLRECSLVLVVRVDKKEQFAAGTKIMVTGRIQFALGFEDDDMSIKNYSSFLDQ